MAMFERANGVHIKGQNIAFNITTNVVAESGIDLLYKNANHGATYDSAERYPPPKCHPNTRKAFVQDLKDWFTDPSRTTRVVWLEGAAGGGKTAIGQTFCELVRDMEEGQLVGSFFLSRSVPGRSNAQQLFITLAYQLAAFVPEARPHINAAIVAHPAIIHKPMHIHLEELIVEPMECIPPPTRPLIVVIDGLDECEGESNQREIVQLVGKIFERNINFPISFLIASRPEPWIRAAFGSDIMQRILWHIPLIHTNQTDHDIRVYYASGFYEIYNNPEHLDIMANVPLPWPSSGDLDNLVRRASGQFIFAATVLKFVADPNYGPIGRLKAILDMPRVRRDSGNSNPLAELDHLYLQILSTVACKQRTRDVLGTLFAIRSAMVGCEGLDGFFPLELDICEDLLNYERGEAYHALRSIHSLVYIPNPSYAVQVVEQRMNPSDLQVRFHHKSFVDFLFDPSRSIDFSIKLSSFYSRTAIACVRRAGESFPSQLGRRDRVAWYYAIIFWPSHCKLSGPPSEELAGCLKQAYQSTLWVLQWQICNGWNEGDPNFRQMMNAWASFGWSPRSPPSWLTRSTLLVDHDLVQFSSTWIHLVSFQGVTAWLKTGSKPSFWLVLKFSVAEDMQREQLHPSLYDIKALRFMVLDYLMTLTLERLLGEW